MEPASVISATVVSLLAPYVKKGAEKFAQAAGQRLFDFTGELFGNITEKAKTDEALEGALQKIEAGNEQEVSDLHAKLTEALSGDPDLFHDISDLLERHKREIELRMHDIEAGGSVVGAIVKERRSAYISMKNVRADGDVTGLIEK